MLWLTDKIRQYPNRKCIIDHDKVFSCKDLIDKTESFYRLIEEHHIQPGDVTGIYASFSLESIALLLCLAEKACVVVPLDPDNTRDIQDAADKAGIEFIFRLETEYISCDKISQNKEKHDLIKVLKQQNKAGLILFSSGTTGTPKIMLHDLSHLIDSYNNQKLKNTNSMILMGFDHIGGIDSLFRLLSIGATITLSRSRTPDEICRQVEKHRVNVLPSTPTFLNLLLLSEVWKQYDLSSLEIIGFGAETMPGPLLQKLKQVFPKVRFQQKFGTSETNAIRIRNDHTDEQFFSIEDPGVEYKIVDGELWLKSKNNILGYLNEESTAFEEGWFKTGDLVELKNGKIRICGRKKEMINVGGEKVLPADVEEILLQHPQIMDCKVYGMDNLITGQVVAADIVVMPDTDAAQFKGAVRQYCKQKLLTFQVPVKINIVDKIELSGRNKKVRL